MHILKNLKLLNFMNIYKNFKVHCNIPMTQKLKATLSKNEDDLKNEDKLKNEDDIKNEDDHKN